ncbi:MAG: MBL fold metallo-hydrolase [Dehalococcoidia bacterium]|nr:MBL fold metallo-hydrolase [Dehalococcoidia bacterium]
MKPSRVWKDVYIIGSSEISHPYDCSVYLVDAGELLLVDSGAGLSFDRLVAGMKLLGFDPDRVTTVLATHAHIDHIGSLAAFRDKGAKIIAHCLDAPAIEEGRGVAAEAYGIDYAPCPVDRRINLPEEVVAVGNLEITVVHVPGHTPGSVAAYLDIDGERVLFGQDIHGPYYPEWGADPVTARDSLQKLIDLKADILCEGHFGVYQPAPAVERFIRSYLDTL